MIDDALVRKYKRQKFFRKIQHTFWSLICIIGALILLYYAVEYMTPWFDVVSDTVGK